MEVLLVPDFTVRSKIHRYKVQFIDDSQYYLKKELKAGDTIIIDKRIKSLYPNLISSLPPETSYVDIDAHENSKSYEGLIPIIHKLISFGFRKNNKLIGIGGGITQDITAFIASVMYRGVGWIYFPTTLLAQGDSCIGSKTSINFGDFKNQIGGFYPPNAIYIDPMFLNTLTLSDQKSGLGEMCHYFVVAGENDFLEYKDKCIRAIKNKKVMTELIYKSLNIKKKYIEIDEFDQKERQVFNYGHSFGHAIETLTGYSIPHGIAVSFGMDMANYISLKMGLLNHDTRKEIRDLLQQIWSGFSIKKIDASKFCKVLAKDKKNVGKELRLILCKGYGKVFKTPVKNDAKLNNWIIEYFENELSD
tara:strand:+ start:3127 stop:4209 length:1083 start_codon:yes stop_codon:yes gene_type:complete